MHGISVFVALRMLLSLLRDARGMRSKAWIMVYHVSRRLGRPRALILPDRLIRWQSVPATLSVGFEAGGLASWHEIAHQHGYAPVPSFRPRPGWTVVDVGANIGTFAAWSAAHLGPGGFILSVEPNPLSLHHLRRTLAQSRTPYEIKGVACSANPGTAELHYQLGYTVSGSLFEGPAHDQSVSVEVSTLDLLTGMMSHIDLLKIDVEDAEVEVLEGATATLAMTQRVVIESYDRVEDKIRALMTRAGFVLAHEQRANWSKVGLLILAFERPLAAV